jgi:hypothetical protein
MKKVFFLIFSLVFSISCFSQQVFQLKQPDVAKLKAIVEKDPMQNEHLLLLYFENNYKATSGKIDVRLDPDFNNKECGYSKKYEFGIVFTTNNCGEASPLKQTITFPRTDINQLKKWVENIYKADLTDVPNKWKGNEYIPKDEEAGCYYTIKQEKEKSTIEIFCGC